MREFRIRSTVLGPERFIHVKVYERRGWMRRVAHHASGDPGDLTAEAVTQMYAAEEEPDQAYADVLLCRRSLSLDIVAHEIHHATLGIYGRFLPPDTPLAEVLTNANEDLAHFYSEALDSILETLDAEGYDILGYRPWWTEAQ